MMTGNILLGKKTSPDTCSRAIVGECFSCVYGFVHQKGLHAR